MFSLEHLVDLPLVWYGLILVAVLLYIVLDGFDLGVGILFPFAPSEECRNRMMNSIAPFWDGNETWLILGGGGLFAAFPLAYAILMPALYVPVIAMLLGLIFRGVAFEFRFKAPPGKRGLWDHAFHFGSLAAAFMQGTIIGAVVQGIPVEGRNFVGGAFDWLNGYSVMTGVALVFGYALLGATWTVMKTEGLTQAWARNAAVYALGWVAAFLAIVSVSMPFINPDIRALWWTIPNLFYLAPIPTASLVLILLIARDLRSSQREVRPFLCAIGVFLTAYLGLGISLYPYAVPYEVSFRQAAAAGPSQSLLLVGTVVLLPIVLAYTAYCYHVFRGKASHESGY